MESDSKVCLSQLASFYYELSKKLAKMKSRAEFLKAGFEGKVSYCIVTPAPRAYPEHW